MRDPTRRYPELSRRGEKILMALLEHPIFEKAAEAAGVSLPTLWRWRQKPEFQKALLEARRDVHSHAMARLQQGAGAAASTVLRVMVDPATPANAKLRAADMVLDIATRGLEFQDLDIRLQELERATRLKAPGQAIPEPASPDQQHDLHEENSNDETNRTTD
jgi:hypothetical protein